VIEEAGRAGLDAAVDQEADLDASVR
jgi:hypothetical protein